MNMDNQEMNMDNQEMNMDNQEITIENEIIPLTLIITDPNTKSYLFLNYICTSLDDCYSKLVINIKKNCVSTIDEYPDNLDEFINNYLYAKNEMNNQLFDYRIFYKNKWSKPWLQQDIYDSVIKLINN
jgi:hypothetical protein